MSSSPPILSTTSLPSVASRPTISCIQCSKDGQIIIVTKSAIHLLTPDLGINLGNISSSSRSANRGEAALSDSNSTMTWFKTLIELDKILTHQWSLDTPEWGALALGSLDVSWRAVSVSPSNLALNAGCFLVTLNSNMEASLWCADKNFLSGEWIKTQDITAFLKELPVTYDEKDDVSSGHMAHLQVLQAQIQCIDWSSQSDFNIWPKPQVDGSLLALGNRRGSVVLMGYDAHNQMKHISTIRVCDAWVTLVSWSSWSVSYEGQCESFLACGASDGSITLLKVTQLLGQKRASTPFVENFAVTTQYEALSKLTTSIGRGLTAISWFQSEARALSLVCTQPGLVRIWRKSANDDFGDECILRLNTQSTSIGSTSFALAAGISYLEIVDLLIIALSDGSLHVIRSASTAPYVCDATEDARTNQSSSLGSRQASRAVRAASASAERRHLRHADVLKLFGCISFDDVGTFAWLHEICRPTDFDFKIDAQQTSMFVVSQILNLLNEVDFMRILERLLTAEALALQDAPISSLRPVFLHLLQLSQNRLDVLLPKVLQLLELPTTHDSIVLNVREEWIRSMDAPTRESFRNSLSRHFYGGKMLHVLRLRLSVAEFCGRISSEKNIQSGFAVVAEKLMQNISLYILRLFMHHFAILASLITDDDKPFIKRVVAQCLLSNSPDLVLLADDLMKSIESSNVDIAEVCPACDAEIPSGDLQCRNGHMWLRCSVTSFLLSTVSVRTCIGCSRKALLPSPYGTSIESNVRSWLVDDVLAAARHCLYCGNRFVRVL